MKRVIRWAVVVAVVSGSRAAETEPLAGFDDYVARAMKTFQVPGAAIAIVKDGKAALVQGYGVRKLGAAAEVNEHTLFGIGSNTKAFTTAALAMLVDEDRIQWDDRVFERLPGFAMYDPYVSHEMTIRDLLTHRSGMGLGEGDLLFFPPTDYTSAQIVQKLRYMKPVSGFRTKYAYDNLLYIAAGEVIQAVTGKSWADTVRERIFRPLGMNDSNTSAAALAPGVNYATPHSLVEGELKAIPVTRIDNSAPAGAINSSASDMAKWMLARLDGGVIPGSKQRLFSEAQSREMWSPQTIVPAGEPPPALAALRTNFAAYGLGWLISEYRGRKWIGHDGGVSGYVSRVALIPEMKLGVTILTNQEAAGLLSSIMCRVFDRYMGVPDSDWPKVFLDLDQAGRAEMAKKEKIQAEARAADSKPSLPLPRYTGTYTDAWYGPIDIAMENQKLVMRFSHTPALTGDMDHWQYDTFKVRWRDRSLNADAFVTFSLTAEGAVKEATMKPVSPLTDFSFDFQDLLLVPARK